MKNHIFDIELDRESGLLRSIVLKNDDEKMNWCAENGRWGAPHHETFNDEFGEWRPRIEFELVDFSEDETSARSVYSNGIMQVDVKRYFDGDGNFRERYTLKNLQYPPLLLSEHNFSVEVPFSDRYTYADECMAHRCHAHIWCGHDTTYINALRMGVSEKNLGLVVKQGAFDGYSVLDCVGNNRGRFLLNIAPIEILKDEEYSIEWVIFPHGGKEDFKLKAKKYESFIDIESEHYTLFKGEKISFSARSAGLNADADNAEIYVGHGRIPFEVCDGVIKAEFEPTELGEYRIWVKIGEKKTFADFILKESFEALLEKRINFIVEHQQYHREGSPLDGAFLIYDNKHEHVIFEECLGDHNACRERLGMAILITRYLQTHRNERLYRAFTKYIAYVKRELFDESTGNVFGALGKDEKRVRLYNAPWMATLFTEAYMLTGDRTYLEYVMELFRKYYKIGGERFYPNGISILRTANAFKAAGMEDEYGEIYSLFKTHVDNMVKNETSYPKHEVNFEQTIVSPAATFISEFAALSGDEAYVREAKKHIEVLERFNGSQPSYHLSEIPIRYWDDFWFGDSMIMGDTFPHYWSCLTARSFCDYYNVSGEQKYLAAARECMRNCLCLFTDDGRGSAAYVYPYKLNKTFGEHYDNWANDQDFALYFALETGLLP